MKAVCLTLICPVSLAILTGFIVQMLLWLGGDIMVIFKFVYISSYSVLYHTDEVQPPKHLFEQ